MTPRDDELQRLGDDQHIALGKAVGNYPAEETEHEQWQPGRQRDDADGRRRSGDVVGNVSEGNVAHLHRHATRERANPQVAKIGGFQREEWPSPGRDMRIVRRYTHRIVARDHGGLGRHAGNRPLRRWRGDSARQSRPPVIPAAVPGITAARGGASS
jgi:hypothetical protein